MPHEEKDSNVQTKARRDSFMVAFPMRIAGAGSPRRISTLVHITAGYLKRPARWNNKALDSI